MSKTFFETSAGLAVSDNTVLSLVNSAVETVLFSQTIVGNSMGVTRELDFYSILNLLTSTLPPALTLKIKFGSSSITVLNANAVVGSLGTAVPINVRGKIINQGSNSTQIMYAEVLQSGTASAFVGTASIIMSSAVWAVDTSIDQLFQVTAQFNAASVNATLTKLHGVAKIS